ncbi:hypothetical protein IMCC26134_03480 [Verrucomicrobia bacterium IMCC26134]|nr:hypothetical protein IMCC26134_03480 [Verrucomicrobia bacterium IMCC26134]
MFFVAMTFLKLPRRRAGQCVEGENGRGQNQAAGRSWRGGRGERVSRPAERSCSSAAQLGRSMTWRVGRGPVQGVAARRASRWGRQGGRTWEVKAN